MPFVATWMDPEIIILSEVSQEEKGQILYDIACKWNLKMVSPGLPEASIAQGARRLDHRSRVPFLHLQPPEDPPA